jgi:hypothetical protein
MIDIDLSKCAPTPTGYGFCIGGNSGEEELVILTSPSQASKAPVIIIRMSVDGGAEVLVNKEWVPDDQSSTLIMDTLLAWATGGVEPTVTQMKDIENKIAVVWQRMCSEGFLI